MDILLENLPQTLPETHEPLSEVYGHDPFEIVETMYEPGMSLATSSLPLQITDFQGAFPLFEACLEVVHRFLANARSPSVLIETAFARALECITYEYCKSRDRDGSGNALAVTQLQNCAQLLKEMLADHQIYIDSRIKHDLRRNHSTEKVERAWAALIKNKANLDEFKKGRPDTVHLEARKIFLPQGATLILEYWQHELNAFVSELETVSIPIPIGGRRWVFHDSTNTT